MEQGQSESNCTCRYESCVLTRADQNFKEKKTKNENVSESQDANTLFDIDSTDKCENK